MINLKTMDKRSLINVWVSLGVGLLLCLVLGVGWIRTNTLRSQNAAVKSEYVSLDIKREKLETQLNQLKMDTSESVLGVSDAQYKSDSKLLVNVVESFSYTSDSYDSVRKSVIKSLESGDETTMFLSKVFPDDKAVYNNHKVSSFDVKSVAVYALDWSTNGDITYMVIVDADTTYTSKSKDVTNDTQLVFTVQLQTDDSGERIVTKPTLQSFGFIKKGKTIENLV